MTLNVIVVMCLGVLGIIVLVVIYRQDCKEKNNDKEMQ
jgi:hypothetical protein